MIDFDTLLIVALIVISFIVPAAFSLKLNKKHTDIASNEKTYRWGYYSSIRVGILFPSALLVFSFWATYTESPIPTEDDIIVLTGVCVISIISIFIGLGVYKKIKTAWLGLIIIQLISLQLLSLLFGEINAQWVVNIFYTFLLGFIIYNIYYTYDRWSVLTNKWKE